MRDKVEKKKIIAKVIGRLEAKKAELERSLKETRKAATEAPGFMQSASDTTKSQMNTLAHNFEVALPN